MTLAGFLFLGVLGAILGSFMNMLIYRLPRDLDIVYKRSFCPACAHLLGPRDLIPLFSYLVQLGKCRYCSVRIPVRYMLVELVSTAYLLILGAVFGASWLTVIWYVFGACALIIFASDMETTQIPDSANVGLGLVGLALHLPHGILSVWHLPNPLSALWHLLNACGLVSAIEGALLGAGFMLGLNAIGKLFYKQDVIGFGDVKLMLGLGMVLGFRLTVAQLYFTALSGGLIAGVLILLKLKKRNDRIPYAPILLAAAVASLLWGNRFITWLNF